MSFPATRHTIVAAMRSARPDDRRSSFDALVAAYWKIGGIVVGSTFKGLVAGVLIGAFATRVRSMVWILVFGVLVSGFFAYLVAAMQGKYYLQIITPGALVGLIVGYAAYRHQT
jgi:hypothetical protein